MVEIVVCKWKFVVTVEVREVWVMVRAWFGIRCGKAIELLELWFRNGEG
jgi:hypothetical protein